MAHGSWLHLLSLAAGTTIFSKAAIVPGQVVAPACKIAATATFQGIEIPTPCLFQ